MSAIEPDVEAASMSMTFELIVIAVADVDRSMRFYRSLGWPCDFEYDSGAGYRVVQFTPPGSPASLMFGQGISLDKPGSMTGLHLIVPDIERARDNLIRRGVAVDDIFHDLGRRLISPEPQPH
jgi:catechol 2,3-dioxygenase-like lactoylglutathione lyase family enzyme